MASVNKVIIVGNLGQDPEVRQFQNGGSVTSISVATSDRWTDRNTGEQKEQTEWHRVSLFNRLGEIAAQYLRKGSSVYIEGSLHTRKYTDSQGIERYSTEIRASQMQMLGARSGGGYGGVDQGGDYQQGGYAGGYQNNHRSGFQNNQSNFSGNNYNQGNFGGNNHSPSQGGGRAPQYQNNAPNQGFGHQPNTGSNQPNMGGNQFMADVPQPSPQVQPKGAPQPQVDGATQPQDDDMPF